MNHPCPGIGALKRADLSGAELARRLGNITSQAISQWRRIPAERVLEVERVTGIPRHELRPDIYPPPHPREAAE
jgi:DNA-binding transcriptional regulator YdaS (Cro superfamily)